MLLGGRDSAHVQELTAFTLKSDICDNNKKLTYFSLSNFLGGNVCSSFKTRFNFTM